MNLFRQTNIINEQSDWLPHVLEHNKVFNQFLVIQIKF